MSKASAKVFKALGLFSSVQAIGIACSVARAKLISIWIGPAGVGLFGIFNSVIEMVSSATQLNMRQSSVRDLAAASPGEVPGIVTSVRWWARVLGLVGMAVMLAFSPLLSVASFGIVGRWWCFALLSVPMLCLSMSMGEQALMQGAGQLKRLARAVACSSLAGTLASVPMYYFLGQGSIVPSLIVFGLASLAAAAWSQDVKGARQAWRQSMAKGREFLKLGAYLTVSSFAVAGASYAFKAYLTRSGGIEATGLYQAGYTLIVNYVGVIFTAIGLEYYPRLVGVAMRGRMASKMISHEMSLLLCVVCPVTIVFLMADELIVRMLYDNEFLAVLPMIGIGIGGALFRAASYCMSFVMLARADGKFFVFIELVSTAIGLSFNIIGWRQWGMAGLGASYALWYAIYALMCWAACRWRYRMRLSGKAMAIALASAAIVVVAILARMHAWWMPAPLLAAAAALAAYAVRGGKKRYSKSHSLKP